MSGIDWWKDSSKTSDWAIAMLPILVRQARSENPLTYGAIAHELGMPHHRPVQRAAGHVGYALTEIAGMRGWRRRPPPPLQSLIINKTTGLPGHGVDGFMSHQYAQAKTKKQREAALLKAHANIYAYPYWADVMMLLGVDPATADLDAISEEATKTSGRGGKGPKHLALKEFVASHPETVGLSVTQKGTTEYLLPSGDKVDVVFSGQDWKTAVEVKSRTSDRGDISRGIYQCVKYRAVMEARSSVHQPSFDVSVILVLGGSLPNELIGLANAFGVSVRENIIPM